MNMAIKIPPNGIKIAEADHFTIVAKPGTSFPHREAIPQMIALPIRSRRNHTKMMGRHPTL